VLKTWLATGMEPVHPWGRDGLEFKAASQASGKFYVTAFVNAGMPGYYGGPTVHIVDNLALTDAFLARLPAIPGARVGHYERSLPYGYLETASNATPVTMIRSLRPLLDDVTLVTRAPIFAEGRWDAIWRLLSGHYNWIYKTGGYGVKK